MCGKQINYLTKTSYKRWNMVLQLCFLFHITHIVMENVINSEKVQPLYRGTQIVWYIFYTIETLLLFRFILRLIGANPAAGFTDLIYTLSYPFVAPFLYVVNSLAVANNIIEWSTLIAMLVYWVLAWGIIRLILINKPVSQLEAENKLRKQDSL